MNIFKTKGHKLHVIVWIIFICYERAGAYMAYGKFANLWNYVALYLTDIPFVYINAYIVFPWSFKSGKFRFVRLTLMIIGQIGVYVLCRTGVYILFGFIHIIFSPAGGTIGFYRSLWLFRAIYLIGISIGYWFAMATLKNQKRIKGLERSQLQNQLINSELEKTLVIAENAFLKSQINPHFLLNTLNFLYNSVAKFSDKIADSVMTLSEIMRYALTNAGEDNKVKLEDEIENISNFIKLNQATCSHRLCIDYEVSGEAGELRIIPLVLITLVENLFKYGDLLDKTNPAKIVATIKGVELIFATENLKRENISEKRQGISLKNIHERLKMYHEYDLKIEENEQFYRSALTVWL